MEYRNYGMEYRNNGMEYKKLFYKLKPLI
jgi:hypothetical protein